MSPGISDGSTVTKTTVFIAVESAIRWFGFEPVVLPDLMCRHRTRSTLLVDMETMVRSGADESGSAITVRHRVGCRPLGSERNQKMLEEIALADGGEVHVSEL